MFYYGTKIKEDGISRTASYIEEMRNGYKIWVERPKGRVILRQSV
jgi:hypothetical protein